MEWEPSEGCFDEVFSVPGGPRSHYDRLVSLLSGMSDAEIVRREKLQKLSLVNQGVTFAVYGEKEGIERAFPFDFVPRILPPDEWRKIEGGLIQRITALNLFLQDIYGPQKCLQDGLVPYELILTRAEFRRELRGLVPARGIYTHVVGTDLIRNDSGEYQVLEDNCRVPSGVSYVLENRHVLSRTFPELFSAYPVRRIEDYPGALLETLLFVAPRWSQSPRIVLLTPGIHNSAYFEHSFLAREMGVDLVEGRDLIVEDNHVFMRTIEGKQRVDVIYRRVDSDFIDPLTFKRDSYLGVPGLINAYREGNVAIANAPGTGVADDKATYAFLPELIRYYLDEDPVLGQVPTYLGFRPGDFKYMLENLDKLVVKTTGASGGYGMLMGPFASQKEIAAYREKMKSSPGDYIGQPLIELSVHPTYLDRKLRPRRIDLRPFVLYGDRIRVMPGGLTRVALRDGSYVVNSSQGGGSKDTWVLEERDA